MTDYEKCLERLSLTADQLATMINTGSVIDFYIAKVEQGDSEIEGEGMFASEYIEEGEAIGLASINKTHKTLLGRYTNHAEDPNCIFMLLLNDDYIMIALKNINAGEELTIDYSEHILNPDYYLGEELNADTTRLLIDNIYESN